ncbi:MAG TPA: STAS domain-containing protein [Micromonosporaceae bacterium]
MDLSVTTHGAPGATVEIRVHGEIDLENAHELREAINGVLLGMQPTAIKVNLRNVAFIDSTAISALVFCYNSAAVSGVPLIVVEPSRVVHRQLWVSGLLGLFGSPEPASDDDPRAAAEAMG